MTSATIRRPRARTNVSTSEDTPTAAVAVRQIPLTQISADPAQPRKIFDPAGLRELAASIRQSGLLQPITVRQVGPQAYMIIAGERRFRAAQLNAASDINAIVSRDTDVATIRVAQIIENDQRIDVTPLEQARSYQGLMDEAGWDVEQLAQQIGKRAFRITERLMLLRLSPDYQALLASGNLKPTEAWELARLSPRGQTTLFNAINAGKCASAADLRATAAAIASAEAQLSLIADEPAPPSKETVALANGFEQQVERLAYLLRVSIKDNQIVAVRKANPHRAGHLADLLGAMQKDLRRIELALREAAVQADFRAI